MTEDHYLHLVDQWYVGTDGLSFTLAKGQVIQDGAKAKAENIGKTRYIIVGYYGTLSGLVAGLHRYLSMDVLARSDVNTLEEYVSELDRKIESVGKLDDMMIGKLKARLGVGEMDE